MPARLRSGSYPDAVKMKGEDATVGNPRPSPGGQDDVRVPPGRNADGESNRWPGAAGIHAAAPNRPSTLEREADRLRSFVRRAEDHHQRAPPGPAVPVQAKNPILAGRCPAVSRDALCRPRQPIWPRDAHESERRSVGDVRHGLDEVEPRLVGRDDQKVAWLRTV